ncbi:MAG: DUF373 family protein [Candidatus Bilamarchaeaceae archaeon]
MERPILILCIDRDNDLYEKGKVSGPIVGREKNLLAATKLGLADPEDSDVNAIFSAIQLYDKMKNEGKTVEIVTLTGDKKLGYDADKKISEQLDRIIEELKPISAILVSDGASDEEVLPIVKSRIKIDSTKIVIVKQAKELEKTYFILLEKIKDPYYSRIIIGIPALLILMLSTASYLGLGWEVVGIVVGAYLIVRMLNIDEAIISFVKDFRFSIEKTSWIGYLGSIILFAIAITSAYQNYNNANIRALTSEKTIAYVVQGTLWPTLIAFFLIIIGKVMDSKAERKVYNITRYALYSLMALLFAMVVDVGSKWVLNLYPPYIAFSDFLLTIIITLVLGYISTIALSWIRTDIISRMKMEGKEVVGRDGSLIGKIVGVDVKEEKLILQTIFEKKFKLPLSSIISIDEKVTVKSEG